MLLRTAYQGGVREIVSTSHYYSAHMALEAFLDRRERRFAELEALMKEEKIDIKLYRGAEVYIDKVILNQKSLKELCFEGTTNILLEIPRSIKDAEEALSLVDRIMSYYNISPIIAHVERYAFLRKNSVLKRLHSMGCKIQMDAEVFLQGFFDKRFAFKALEEGLLDVIASDCHDIERRTPNLAEAYEVIRKKAGDDTVFRLQANAKKLITA